MFNTITIPASALKPGFSVYIIEVQYEGASSYYVGMTGDGHYVSARSSFARLAGHFDTSAASTQSQLRHALKKYYPRPLPDSVKIVKHHAAIPGFEPIEGTSNKKSDTNYFRNDKYRAEVEKYEKRRREVFALESYLIGLFQQAPHRCFNRTSGSQSKPDTAEFDELIEWVRTQFAV